MYLPEFLTKEQENVIAKISDRLIHYGVEEHLVCEWWQKKTDKLNDHCPLEAVVDDKFHLAEKYADYFIDLIECEYNKIAGKQT